MYSYWYGGRYKKYMYMYMYVQVPRINTDLTFYSND